MPRVETDIEKRFEQGCLHDERAEHLVHFMAATDQRNKNKLSLLCEDGISLNKEAEYLVYLLDIYFEMKDIT